MEDTAVAASKAAPDSPAVNATGRTSTISAGDSDSSAFLLLSTSQSHPSFPTVTLARPRFLPVLGIAALVDEIVTLAYAIAIISQSSKVGAAFVWGFLRPFVVFFVIGSARVRERGWVVLGQVGITVLVDLYHFNELVQSRTFYSHLPSSPMPSSALASSSPRPTTVNLSRFTTRLTTMTQYLIISLVFSVLHWVLFATFVGIRRRSNPFARAGGAGLRGVPWAEQRWEGREETVGATSEIDEEEEFEQEGDSEDDEESEEDEDAIIDIPRSGDLRSRPSRISLTRDDSTNSRASDRERRQSLGGIGNSARYGSINSLAGI